MSKYWQRGASIFELMLVITVIALFTVVALRQISVGKGGRVSKTDLARMQTNIAVQTNIAALRQAAEAYYYANCHDSSIYGKLISCEQMVAVQGFATMKQCEAASRNPWGTIIIVYITPDIKMPHILIQSEFSDYPGGKDKQALDNLVKLLEATKREGLLFSWDYVHSPYRPVVDIGVWQAIPGNYNAVSNTTAVAGTSYAPGLWVMNNNLNLWATDQARAIQLAYDAEQKKPNPDRNIKPPSLCIN
jgi:hypothetical protein